jgi:hypothetical protein
MAQTAAMLAGGDLMRALILAAALCGCQRYDDLAGPVSEPSREITGPGACIVTLEWPSEYDAADSSATCWDGSRPHMVQYSRPRLSGKGCGESIYMPDGQVRRWYGCQRVPADTIPI